MHVRLNSRFRNSCVLRTIRGSMPLLASMAACSAQAGAPTDESVGSTSEAVCSGSSTRDIDADTAYPAVGWLVSDEGACSATLIARQVVLTSAHCMTKVANGNRTKADWLAKKPTVQFWPDGVNAPDATSYVSVIDDLEVAPSGFLKSGACAQPFSAQQVSGDDIALLHLKTAITDITPERVITSLADNINDSSRATWPYGAHVTLEDSATSQGASFQSARPLVSVAGWGRANGPGGRRRAGTMQLSGQGTAWDQGCRQEYACASPTIFPYPEAKCSLTGVFGGSTTFSGGAFSGRNLRLERTQTSPGANNPFDGPFMAPGDSGSPAIVPGAVVPLDYGSRYIMGTLSRSIQWCPADNGAYPAEYSATFAPENGAFIEQTQAYWASAEYARRGAASWSNVDGTIGGGCHSDAAVTSMSKGSLDAFAIGLDDALWHWNTRSSAWERLQFRVGTPLRVGGHPSATSWGPNRIDVMALGTDGGVKHTYFNLRGWHEWEDLGAPSVGVLAGTSPSAASYAGGLFNQAGNVVDVYVTGNDHAVYHRAWMNGWTAWQLVDIPTFTSFSPAAIATAPDRIELFVVGGDGGLYGTSFNYAEGNVGTGWQSEAGGRGWFPIGGFINSDPAAVSWAPGRVDVFGRTPNGDVWQRTRDIDGWHGWTDLQGSSSTFGAPAVASWSPGHIDLITCGSGRSVARMQFNFDRGPFVVSPNR
jgi:hypothetical protein